MLKNKEKSFADIRQEKRNAVMPKVKDLVKEYGREPIIWCINQLREYEKKIEQLKKLKSEARILQKEIAKK